MITRGICTTEENGTFLAKDFERNRSYNSGVIIKGKSIINIIINLIVKNMIIVDR